MKYNAFVTILVILMGISSCKSPRGKESANTYSLEHINSADSLLQILQGHYNDGDMELAREGASAGIRKFGQTDELVNMQYKVLLSLEKYEEALAVFEVIIERFGDDPDIIVDKIRLLRQLDRQDEALQLSLATDRKHEKSPYMSLMIADIYISKEEQDSAIHWLEKSNERGFNEFDYLLSEQFSSLHERKSFQVLIAEMKNSAGIGSVAKDFSIKTTEGGSFTLSEMIGKVVLIDFWATWCPPCVAEFPHLDSLYSKYRDRGFEIISISADRNKESISNFLERHSPDWGIGFSGDGRDDAVVKLYNISSYPTYILVDKNGDINNITSYGGEKLEALIEKLME